MRNCGRREADMNIILAYARIFGIQDLRERQ